MQQFLKPARGAARAGVVAPEFFAQFLVAVDEAGDLSLRALDACFGREAFSAFTRGLETSIGRGVVVWFAWHTSILYAP